MLSKACIVGIYQRKLEAIAHLGVDLLTLVPPSWKDERGETKLERVYTDGYRLEVLPIRFNGNFHLHYYPDIGAHIRAFQPDIVHVDEEPYNLAAWHALHHARRAGAKALFFSWQNLNRRYPPPFSWGERWVLDHVDYGLMGTESAAAVWREKGYRGRMAVVPQFGVDPELFQPSAASSQPSGHPFTIGYVGRLVSEKGIDLLIQAAARLSGEWRLRVIGSGPARGELGALAKRLGTAGRIEWIEWIASTEMPEQYRRLDAVVLPSITCTNWKEQFGRVLTEAMASGIPVIGSDSGAIPDIIGSAGFIVPEANVDALTDALCRLQKDAVLRAECAAKGRARVLAQFTHQQVAEATVHVYREMLDSTGRSPVKRSLEAN
jgi:glycosyltransferase involved in cell wall biosynthesis